MKISRSNRTIDFMKHEPQKFPSPNRKCGVYDSNSRRFTRPSTSWWSYGALHFSRFCPFNKHKCTKCGLTGHKEGFCKRSKPLSHYRMPRRINCMRVLYKSNLRCVGKYLSINVSDRIITLQLNTTSDVILISHKTWYEISRSCIYPTNECIKTHPNQNF